MPTIELHHRCCLEHMRTMSANSVDAIVTDPPYGLGFMGKQWDHGVPGVAFWVEALRVAKPGAHIVAFGGTRTFHRLAVAIEDAGWDIRDTLMYLYGSGFPKSHNLKRVFCTCAEGSESKAEHGVRPVLDTDIPEAVASEGERGQVLLPFVPEQGASEHGQSGTEPEAAGCEQPGVEGRRNHLQEEGELPQRPVCSGAGMGEADGPEGRVHNGAPVDNGSDCRASADQDGGGSPCGSQPDEQQSTEHRNVAGQRDPQEGGMGAACGRCGKPLPPFPVDGWGTALKPAWEPILLARKPLVGTVAENVLQHRTGGINVDGCRVPAPDGVPQFTKTGSESVNCYGNGLHGSKSTGEVDTTTGRWPANVLHDGSDDVVGMFPDTESTMGAKGGSSPNPMSWGEARADGGKVSGFDDQGSAARFFYAAKASKADRDEGLERFELKAAGGMDGRNYGSMGSVTMSRNIHPTVKPTDLMRWLCRLVTPPRGIVFDPFMGSGSTGKAAVAEGFSFIGCDLEAVHVDIARVRVAYGERIRHEELGLFAELDNPIP